MNKKKWPIEIVCSVYNEHGFEKACEILEYNAQTLQKRFREETITQRIPKPPRALS